MNCSNCGAAVTPGGAACKFCGAALTPAASVAPVGTVGAQVDQLLASIGVQAGTPEMSHIQDFLRTQQSLMVGGVAYQSLAHIPPEARRAFVIALLAQRQAAMARAGGLPVQFPEAAMGARRRRSGCGCAPFLFLLILIAGLYAYWYFIGPIGPHR